MLCTGFGSKLEKSEANWRTVFRRILPDNITRDMVFKYIVQSAGFIDNIAYSSDDLKEIDHLLSANNLKVPDIVAYLHQSCDDLLVKCRWESKMRPCAELFEYSMSYHGGCCTFSKYK